MKATAQTIIAAPLVDKKTRLTVLSELIKARLTMLVLLTTLVGFYVGCRGAMDNALLFHTMLGTALVASGAAALNQLLEREYDAKMRRTEDRPLPSGRLAPETVLIMGGASAAVGMLYLALAVNLLTSLLGAVTLVSYLFVYTPLKRVTSLNTAVGAIPGALPPLMGWVAARNEITIEGWALFAILFFWQLPHFLAIAWMYREDYARAGFVMLPVIDPQGHRTGRQAVSHTLGLLPISLCPFLFRVAGPVYVFGALVLGLGFLWFAIQFSRHLTRPRARQLFYASILYLPLLLGLMVFDKLR
ncbi:MAG: protoheme IX farnesyltransferase [Verrucomicrobia bacterium]|nr:protoheme IX farnesyltransferase [Verrucomicrobiota bacterium]